jgi:hypothetical protein
MAPSEDRCSVKRIPRRKQTHDEANNDQNHPRIVLSSPRFRCSARLALFLRTRGGDALPGAGLHVLRRRTCLPCRVARNERCAPLQDCCWLLVHMSGIVAGSLAEQKHVMTFGHGSEKEIPMRLRASFFSNMSFLLVSLCGVLQAQSKPPRYVVKDSARCRAPASANPAVR